MSEALPEPLVPPEVDLRGYDFMPLFGDVLMGSAFNATTNDTAWRIGVTLWWKSWNTQVPAASLPDDESELTMLCGLGRDVKTFRKVKAIAMHGFVKCSDGRLYHRFLAQHAMDAFKSRLSHRFRTTKARIAAIEKRLKEASTDEDKAHLSGLLQDLRQSLSQTIKKSVTDAKKVSDRVSAQNPQGEGQGQLEGEGYDKKKRKPDAPAEADADPWLVGKEFLIKRGITAGTVGGFIGKLVKDHGKENVINALQNAIVNEPADVKSYVVGILRGKTAGKFDPVAYNAGSL